MNYRHIYHAGNFADVVKHVVLVEIVIALQRKEKGFCYIDTHAGIGRYDLSSIEAQKTTEYKNGIGKVLAEENMPAELQKYLEIVRNVNLQNPLFEKKGFNIQFYPGSPYIVRNLLRPQDRMTLNELHPEDVQSLKQLFKHDKQVAIHQRDAYEFLNAILPPAEKRSLILIDPAYEKEDEIESLLMGLQKAMQRFSNGVYAIWLPIKDVSYQDFYKTLKQQFSREILIAELTLSDVPEQSFGLVGCAMIIINPPYLLADAVRPPLEQLWQIWTQGRQGEVIVYT